MPKRAVFERSRRELSLDVSVGVHILLVVEQSTLESQSRGCAKTPILTVLRCRSRQHSLIFLLLKVKAPCDLLTGSRMLGRFKYVQVFPAKTA